MSRYYEDDREHRFTMWFYEKLPMCVLNILCDLDCRFERFARKFQKKREPYTGDIKFYFDLYDESGNPKQQ